MKMVKERKGQFIVIAALLLSIMIVSVTTVIYGTVTYFRQERWEEYVTIVDSVRTGSYYVLEISLAKYSQTLNSTILRDNLNQWIRDVRKAHPGFGVDLSFTLATGVRSVYGISPNYSMGLNYTWNKQVSYSAANATFNLNIASVGLTGYNFSSHAFLKMNIADALWYEDNKEVGVRMIIEAEGPTPVTNLQKTNFNLFTVGGTSKLAESTLYRYYDSKTHKAFVYELRYSSPNDPGTLTATIGLVDARGIKVTGQATLQTVTV